MKTILLLTDFSKSATNAIQYAMRFFESETCKFYVMHVHKAGSFISDDLMVSTTESIYESITKVPKQKLDALIGHLKKEFHNQNHTFDSIIDFDVFTDAVNQAVKKKSVDYVVMGSNGATSAKEIIFGSNTINVLRHVFCKTLVIPEGYTFKPISNFFLPLQYDDNLEYKQLNVIDEFIKQFNFKLHVLRTCKKGVVSTHSISDQDQLKQFEYKYSVEKDIAFEQAVINYLKSDQIDMLSLIVHDKSFIKRFFTESPTIELSKIIKIPLLIFHNKNN
ncbi:universal stress protein [Psychroserpens sp.]|uniref:universal stress protein n=1 Tax=Psychroserpens sp. TaxID=2020870 RepID=UPI00385C4F6E